MKNTIKYFIIICFYHGLAQNLDSQDDLVILVSNEYQISTNFGTGIDLKTMSRMSWETDKKQDTIHCPLNRFRKLYIKNDNSFFFVNGLVGDTLEVHVSLKESMYRFRNRNKNEHDGQSLQDLNLFYPNQQVGLDSLYKEKMLSLPDFEYNKSELKFAKFLNYIKKINTNNRQETINKLIRQYFNDEQFLNDDFFGFGYVQYLVRNVILENEKRVLKTKVVYDYKRAYYELPNYLNGKWLKFSQFYCLINMGQDCTPEEMNLAIDSFNQRFNDGILSNRLRQHPFLLVQENKLPLNLESLKNEIDQTYFANSANKKITLKEIIRSNYGRVIYIDFWASWCVPCRNEMPNSKLLSKKFKDKDVTLLYFSIDKNQQSWSRAAKTENLRTDQSYLAINFPSAEFYKQINLRSIPRYLLFNKKGELVNDAAPRPSDQRIITLINSLLMDNIKQ